MKLSVPNHNTPPRVHTWEFQKVASALLRYASGNYQYALDFFRCKVLIYLSPQEKSDIEWCLYDFANSGLNSDSVHGLAYLRKEAPIGPDEAG